MLDLSSINHTWTIFLDRDGVLNHEKPDDYIYNYDEFIFYNGALHALKILADTFGKCILVTNQRGIGRGLMTDKDLELIHHAMVNDIKATGGRLDAIYYCPANDNQHPNRKPNPGMFFEAVNDFPDIDPGSSLMIGNNISDMEFGRNAGISTVFVKTTHPGIVLPHPAIDLAFDSLADFAKALENR